MNLLAMLLPRLLLNDNWGAKNREGITKQILEIETNELTLADAYEKAKQMLLEIRTDSLKNDPNPTLYFKAGDVQRQLARILASSGQ